MNNLSVVDKGDAGAKHELAIESFSNPDALLFKGTKRHPLKATVCGACGNVNFSVENYKELWVNYQKK
ncbi:hypothetical protein [uncultured Croceitalea sp.]|uniref:hypothetical protein n=1 Tax=uncultured Croceitalea sp. TaxID=1798908 RepID=UPI003305E968